ncbi:MAG TPA: hypothetical protein VKT19_00055 [Steroidobacteraceae bacterium]|nr:hypothetical protein [Steroidobacteraceae bacterium]
MPEWAQQSYQRYLQMKAMAHGGTRYTRQTAFQMPDWSGLWVFEADEGFAWDGVAVNKLARGLGAQSAQAILDHCQSFPCRGWVLGALTPRYAMRYREKLAAVTRNVEWDPVSDCLPPGFPRILIAPFGKEFIATPDETWATALPMSEVRRIYTDGRGHTPESEAFATWDGDSIGFWDGDTLVAHTLYLRANELQRNQPDFSDQASVLERIRMRDPDTLEDDTTLYDPVALSAPWHAVHEYARIITPHSQMDMWSCDPNIYQTKQGGTDLILPGDSVTLQRDYRDPEDDQNFGLDRVREYGARVLKAAPSSPGSQGR